MFKPVLRIRFRSVRSVPMFLGLLDPVLDPLVRGTDQGLFYHQAKVVRKALIPTVLWLIFYFLSLKNELNVPSKCNNQNKLKVSDENSKIRIH